MYRILIASIFLIITANAAAQINEIGVFAGGSNYIGDIGPTTYIAPEKPALGILYRWNRSPRHSYRFSLIHAKLAAADMNSDVSGRRDRYLAFKNTVTELSAGMEFSFFDFNLHTDEFKLTPYVYTGLSYFFYDESYFNNSGRQQMQNKKATLAIPMILGLKAHIAPSFVLGVEAGARYTFTDNLDGSHPENESLGFGNLESNDWYVFTGVTLTYTFGNRPCYCAE